MPLPCTLKVLAAQLLVGLVAACAILGIKFTSVPAYQLHGEAETIGSPVPGSLAVEDLQTRALSAGLEQRPQIASTVPTPIVPVPAVVPDDDVPYQHKHSVYKRAHRFGDLPALRSDMSPDSEMWDNSIAICACMFGENATDVREWIMYNRWLGVDHIYLTENGPTPPDSFVSEIEEFIDDGFVTFKSDPRPSFQQTIYVDCMNQHRHKHNCKDIALKQFLDDYKHESALVMHWMIVGPSHQETRPQEGGVLRAYRECQTQPSNVVKSIVNTFYLANMASNPHTFEYRNNKRSVDEHRRPMPWRYPIPTACLDGTIRHPNSNLDCRPLPHVQKRPASVDHIALFHYITRSKEDFERKVARGGGRSKHRNWGHFNRVQKEASSTGGLCDEAFEAAEECCKLENYVSAAKRALEGPKVVPPEATSPEKKQRNDNDEDKDEDTNDDDDNSKTKAKDHDDNQKGKNKEESKAEAQRAESL